jgi:hypothetical protein
MSDGQALRNSRLGQNEALYRSVNERLKDINTALDAMASIESHWICECDDMDCTTTVVASIGEYEAVRASPRTFIVAPGHVNRENEHVVQGNERFTVVEKEGAAAETAEATYTESN